MPAKRLTSISDSRAANFTREQPVRATLFCDQVKGLHLIKLATGSSWRYRYTDTTGKRRTVTIGAYPALKPVVAAEKALKWLTDGTDPLTDKEKRREAAQTAQKAAEQRTLGKYLEKAYSRHQARKKDGVATVKRIRSSFSDWLERDMASLTRSDVVDWQELRESDGVAYTTMQREYTGLKTLLNHAVKHGSLDRNPLGDVSLEQPANHEREKALRTKREAERRLLTDDELNRLHLGLEAFSEDLRRQRRNSRKHGKPDLPDLDQVAYPHWFVPFTYCALYTGLRPGDLYSLTWQELNLPFKRMKKTPEKTQHHRDPAEIDMPLPRPFVEIMLEWHRQQGKPKTGLVFVSPVTGDELDRGAHRRPWAQVKRLGRLPDDLVFYALRHHFVSSLVANNVPLLAVAKLVGHKSTAMIERHYGHLRESTATEAMTAFADSLRRRAS